jgi:predicted ferric reductase
MYRGTVHCSISIHCNGPGLESYVLVDAQLSIQYFRSNLGDVGLLYPGFSSNRRFMVANVMLQLSSVIPIVGKIDTVPAWWTGGIRILWEFLVSVSWYSFRCIHLQLKLIVFIFYVPSYLSIHFGILWLQTSFDWFRLASQVVGPANQTCSYCHSA